MKKYRVPVKFTYTAYVDVEADSPNEAWRYVMDDLEKDDILYEERGMIPTDELDWDYTWIDCMDVLNLDEVVEEVEE